MSRIALDGVVDRIIGVVAPGAWNMEPLMMTLAEAEAMLPGPFRFDGSTRPHQARPRSAERRPEVRPRGIVRDVWVAEAGLLGVLLHVAADDWREARVALENTVAPFRAEAGFDQQRYDTIIDLVDIGTGEVVARRRVEGTLYVRSGATLYRPSVGPGHASGRTPHLARGPREGPRRRLSDPGEKGRVGSWSGRRSTWAAARTAGGR